MSVRVFVEGGGDKEGDLRGECREAFRKLIHAATGLNVKVIACGSRNEAYDAFETALKRGDEAVLLVNSEEALRSQEAWEHLRQRDRWNPLDGPAFLMVLMNETWLLSDLDAFDKVFRRFKRDKIPAWPNLESTSKKSIQDALDAAVRDDRKYGFTKADCFKVLKHVDSGKLSNACPRAETFFAHLRAGA